jgi:hypothetical protein
VRAAAPILRLGPAAAAAACIRAGDRRAPGISFTRTGTAIVSPSGGVFLNDAAPSSSAWKGRDNGALGIDPSRSDRAPADGFYAGDGLGAVFDDSPAGRPPTPRAGDRGAESGPDVERHRVMFSPTADAARKPAAPTPTPRAACRPD